MCASPWQHNGHRSGYTHSALLFSSILYSSGRGDGLACVAPGPVSNGTTSALKCSTGSLFHSGAEGAEREKGGGGGQKRIIHTSVKGQ